MSDNHLRALLVERLPLMRKAICEVLLRAGVSTIECRDDLPLHEDPGATAPDIFVASLSVIDLHGAAVVPELRTRFADSFLVVTSEQADRRRIFELLARGVDGFIPKTMEIGDMVAAYRSVLSGNTFVPTLHRECEPACDAALTRRQVDILRYVQQGLTNKEIARKLGISPETVKVHLNNVYRAIGVHNRTAAIAALGAMGGLRMADRERHPAPIARRQPPPRELTRTE